MQTEIKHTAVETIIKCLEENQYFIGNDLYDVLEQAKKIEKQQMIEMHDKGFNYAIKLCEELNK